MQKEDLAHPQKETTQWVELVDSQNQFIAKGYLGKQNKGIGWVLSQQKSHLINHFLNFL
ncbi:hypothetical protein [Enterococcus faecium]|uniref:hypothetical protein n=1 Tax=Enterococcus faecium TaxID=1352 RepID=UPI002161C8C3|nr:hypothetical protein [Enterococcus faecium]